MYFYYNETNGAIIVRPLYPPRPIQFSILLTVAIISIPCFVFVLYYLLRKRTVYSALQNHVIIILLVFNSFQTLTDVPIYLAYYYTGIIWPPTVQFCIFRSFLDLDLFTTSFLLLTWASFERHVHIFHSNVYNIFFKRLFIHYIPLGFCCVYPIIYYIVFILFYPCKNYYDVSIANCYTPCYLFESSFMALYEQIAHGIALMLIILVFNLALIVRVFRQKRRTGRQLTWSKNRRMTIQLLSICLLFFLTNGGYFLIQLGRMLGYENFGRNAAGWLFPLSMCMPPLVSFACLNTIHNCKKKIKRLLRYQHHRSNTVAPILSIAYRSVRT